MFPAVDSRYGSRHDRLELARVQEPPLPLTRFVARCIWSALRADALSVVLLNEPNLHSQLHIVDNDIHGSIHYGLEMDPTC